MGNRRGRELDEIIKDMDRERPFYELGEGYCKRGHSVRFPQEYWLSNIGNKKCKRCAGVHPRIAA